MAQPWDKEFTHKQISIRARVKDVVKTSAFAAALVAGIYISFVKNCVNPK